MDVIRIRKGKDIKLVGAAEKRIVDSPLPSKIAIQPADFRGIRVRLLIKEGQPVKIGTALFEDKDRPEIRVVSPVSGRVTVIVRGEKRVLLQIVIQPDGKQEPQVFDSYPPQRISSLSRNDITKLLLDSGVWPCIRQRPFSKVAHPQDIPKSIFVQGMNTEPLSLDVDVILAGREKDFQVGVNVLKKLTSGAVHLCISEKAASKALTQAEGVNIQRFAGPHPTGNVSTFIAQLDPIHKGELVWYVRAEDVVRIGELFQKGIFSPERFVAITGEGAKNRVYRRTIIGAPVAHLLDWYLPEGMRYISGSVLAGTNVGKDGYVGFYDSQITVIPEGGKRKFLGWLDIGFDKYSFSNTFASAMIPAKAVSLDTDKNGSDRAIVLNNIFDQYVALDVYTFFLLRAVLAGEVEEAEKLGILECDEEDFALASFVCPSKTNVGAIIRQGLDLIEKEG